MSTLVVEELKGELSQVFSPFRRLLVVAVRPYLYAHNFPAGTFKLQLIDADDVVAGEQTFTAEDIYTGLNTTNAYAHAYLRVQFPSPVSLPPGDYLMVITSTGYTFSENSYLAWVKEYEDKKVNTTYIISGAEDNPLSFELWSYEI